MPEEKKLYSNFKHYAGISAGGTVENFESFPYRCWDNLTFAMISYTFQLIIQ